MTAPRRLLLLCALPACVLAGAAGAAEPEFERRYYRTPGEFVAAFEKLRRGHGMSASHWVTYHPGPAVLDDREVEGLLLLLESANWEVREYACSTLGRRGDKRAVEPLIKHLLTDEHFRVREDAAFALGRLGDRRAVVPLLAVLRAAPPASRRVVGTATVKIVGEDGKVLPAPDKEPGAPAARLEPPAAAPPPEVPAPPPVGEDLEVRPPKYGSIRTSIAGALARLGDKRAVPYLLYAMTDSTDHTRRYVARALGELRAPPQPAGALILPLLGNKEKYIRHDALQALGRVRAAAACEAVLARLQKGEHGKERALAAEALGGIGEARAVPHLLKALEEDKDSGVRGSAARALGRLGDGKAVAALKARFKTDKVHTVRARAAKALCDLKDPAGMAGLLELLRAKGESNFSHPVSEAFSEMGDEAVRHLLAGLADEKSLRLSHNCAVAMGYLDAERQRRCVEGLGPALAHKNPKVRGAACAALRYIGQHRPEVAARALEAVLAVQLNDESLNTRGWALAALACIGRRAAPKLLAAARNPRTAVNAAGAMTRIRDRRFVPVLEALASSRDPEIRAVAVSALGNQFHEKGLTVAVARLGDESGKVREAALRVIAGRWWARQYLPQVAAKLNDPSDRVRREAAATLNTFKDLKAVPLLEARLRTEKDTYARKAMQTAIDDIKKKEKYRKINEERRRKAEEERRKKTGGDLEPF